MATKQIIAKMLGFTHSGKSLIGSQIIKLKNLRKLRVSLISGLFLAISLPSFVHKLTFATNIGGIPIINVIPKIEATVKTNITVRLPVEHYIISRGYNWIHSGADLAASIGEPIYPIMDGIVIYTENGWFGYGNYVVVSHGDDLTTLYGHMSRITTVIGQKVGIHDKIGEIGSTGFSTGPHLHLELRKNNTPVDPAEILTEVKDR